jgi:hypothetical protein
MEGRTGEPAAGRVASVGAGSMAASRGLGAIDKPAGR